MKKFVAYEGPCFATLIGDVDIPAKGPNLLYGVCGVGLQLVDDDGRSKVIAGPVKLKDAILLRPETIKLKDDPIKGIFLIRCKT